MSRLLDKLYETALKEVESNMMAARIRAEAAQIAGDDQKLLEETYVKLRVEQLKKSYKKLAQQAQDHDDDEKKRKVEEQDWNERKAQEEALKAEKMKAKRGEDWEITYLVVIALGLGIFFVVYNLMHFSG